VSRSDYRRPADYQVRQIAKCSACGREGEYMNDQQVDGTRCRCGGSLQVIGESYPADSEEWDEERDTQDGQWRRRS
jgi:hypothetical protein